MKENENKILLILMGVLVILNIIFVILLASTSQKINNMQSDITTIKKQQSEIYDYFIYDDNELIESEYVEGE